jgi:uncharacterized Zn finger protein
VTPEDADRLEVYVNGSGAEPYRVTIEKLGPNIKAFCTCPAGMNGQWCKHRLRIFSGNAEGVVSGNVERLPHVVDWLVGTDVERALSELALAEDRYSSAKRELSSAKRRLAEALRS